MESLSGDLEDGKSTAFPVSCCFQKCYVTTLEHEYYLEKTPLVMLEDEFGPYATVVFVHYFPTGYQYQIQVPTPP